MENRKIVFDSSPVRIDVYLKQIYPDFSREFVKKLITKWNVKVNSRDVKPSYILKYGDIIDINFASEVKEDLNLEDIILFEDKDLIIVNKPEGLLVHPTDDNWLEDFSILSLYRNTLVWLIYNYMGKKSNSLNRLGLVHRLDAETSGVMVIAKNLKSQKNLMEQFASRKVKKIYKALVKGIIRDDKLMIDAPIGRTSGSKKLKVFEFGRDALTEIEVLKRGKYNSYLNVYPLTGRTNQIRVHLSYIKHPIIGDRIYSGPEYKRLMLHSHMLSFIHPSKNKPVKFEAKPSKSFVEGLKELLNN